VFKHKGFTADATNVCTLEGTNRRVPSTNRRVPSTNRRVPSTNRRVPSADPYYKR